MSSWTGSPLASAWVHAEWHIVDLDCRTEVSRDSGVDWQADEHGQQASTVFEVCEEHGGVETMSNLASHCDPSGRGILKLHSGEVVVGF